MNKLVLHIPHSSTYIPFYDGYVKDREKIIKEIEKLTDWYTDDLFTTETDYKIITPFSRIFCDVERFSDDHQEEMTKFGMGMLYEKFDNGELLRMVTSDLRELIFENYYKKHHTKFLNLVKKSLEEKNECLILDCHSFPNNTLNCAVNKSSFRPDFNIGTDSFHTPKKLIELSKKYFKELGYSLGIDEPYCGSIVPIEYYKKDDRVSSIMLEINRKLYLSGTKKTDNYQKIKKVVQGYIRMIANS